MPESVFKQMPPDRHALVMAYILSHCSGQPNSAASIRPAAIGCIGSLLAFRSMQTDVSFLTDAADVLAEVLLVDAICTKKGQPRRGSAAKAVRRSGQDGGGERQSARHGRLPQALRDQADGMRALAAGLDRRRGKRRRVPQRQRQLPPCLGQPLPMLLLMLRFFQRMLWCIALQAVGTFSARLQAEISRFKVSASVCEVFHFVFS